MKTTIEYIKSKSVTVNSQIEALEHIAARFGCKTSEIVLQREADDDDETGYDLGETAFVPGNPNAVAWLTYK